MQKKLAALGIPVPQGMQLTFYKPGGCQECSNTGYRSRVALHEVMNMSDELEHLVTGSATGSDLREAALRGGMVTLRQDGFLKAAQGITTIEEVLRVSA